ncbi:MAG: nickel pincer cofactor biosynthesis protein LarB [Chloroflexales bacterium]|nr:nickel pincer cofactor biosynthesis protein LarB [Chloroflexales bacterium]
MHHFDEIFALTQIARPDGERQKRTGIPEIILADRKSLPQNLTIAADLLEREGRAILSRVSPELLVALQERFPNQVETSPSGFTAVVRGSHGQAAPSGGRVGLLTAGTSDIPIAEEAALMCRELGCTVQSAYDVGVAGLHRLREPLGAMLDADPVDVIIVAAGMDGALPSVVAGLVDVPVIGLPISIGYGLGGGGVAALLTMLQSCAPGLAVVNIDNGIGAGAMAALIANRTAAARIKRE